MTARIKLKVAPKGASSGKKKPSKKKPVGKKHPNLERQFQLMWDIIGKGYSSPKTQFIFDPIRKWRFDFAWPEFKVAVEIDGGVFQKKATGHRSIGGIVDSMEKQNAAQLQGWCLLRYHVNDLERRTVQVVEEVKQAIRQRGLPSTQ